MTARWTQPTRRTLIAAFWSAGITLATASYLALIYTTLPARVPVRYLRGEPVFYQLKTPFVVMLPALVQVALLLTFSALALLLLWRPRSANGHAGEAADHERMALAVEGIAALGAVWISVQAIGAARLVALWHGGRGGFGTAYNVTVLVSLALSAVIVWRTMQALRQKHTVSTDTDPSLWRFTHLYFNPSDPALFVPRRRGIGWTLNFGRPLAIVLIAAILTIGVGGPFLLARALLWDGAVVMFTLPTAP